jgi:hypothetical protein
MFDERFPYSLSVLVQSFIVAIMIVHETDDNHIEPSRKFANNTKDIKNLRNQLLAYRQQYINDGHQSHTNNQPKFRNEKRLLTQASSFT